MLGITRGFLKYAKRKGLVTFSITEAIADMDLTDASFRKHVKRDEMDVFSETETAVVMNYLADHPDIWKIVETQMGHTDILCTERHYHRDRRSLEEKRRLINEIPEFQAFKSSAS